ncbi:DUF2207 domain-containing protein [Chryseoglobus sp. 28M-23]|uniref:DUF2207 domain-containing protein n=1 Tax=Chryseoglobus sp. 28M-23 TaxID=2772253 RepID=UPI001746E7C8|nr:DUF2207 domain-containing protein [Chryseoglobus sp. 28M-23]QOD92764.1 DUF2207 domain-containing protein [Chryseoglobus sp. 28M-23]
MSDDLHDDERIADDPPRHTFLWALLSGWLLSLEAWLRSHGGEALRIGIRFFWGAVAAVGLFLLVGPVLNPPLTLDDITSSASTATETWIARDFAADYTVDLADDGTLVVTVEERITAFFGDEVDERGIERVLATEYEGHALAPSGVSATLDGEPLDVGETATATRLTLDLDAGERLQGDHEFVLNYSLHHLAYETTDRATGEPVQLLEWDVFGASWPQGLAGLDVTVSLPDELDANLVRQPRGSLAWTIVGAGAWLTPEETSPDGRTDYAFSNDQNIPPNANAWFTVVFEPGSIVMPPQSPLFWVQTFGPLAPLAFLLVTLLLAIAARAVAWSDARGRPWFVARFEPPKGITPGLAAHILRAPHALELAESLDEMRHAPRKGNADAQHARLLAVGRAARRTGRLGNVPRALRLYADGPERALQLQRGLRRIPRGFVRDTFIAAPLALTLVQWGLVRQLSYQAPLAVVWWPVAFVAASTLIAAIVLALALTARPLTTEGALLKQHLRGIGVYAERTSLLERGTLREAVLPYAVLLAPPREAGGAITRRVETELGGPLPRRSWHTGDYLTGPRLAVRGLALLVAVGAIAVAAVLPNPFVGPDRYLAYTGDVPGSAWTQVESFAVSAELSRGDDGRAVLVATESLEVLFEEGSSLPPQLVRNWRSTVDGQDLELGIRSVSLDGDPVEFATETDGDTLAMRTALATPLAGLHEVRIEYTMASAAYATHAHPGGEIVDRVRWAALLDGWEYEYGGEDGLLDPLRVELRVPLELLDAATQAGWTTIDTDSAERAADWVHAVVPFGETSELGDGEAVLETLEREDGMLSRTIVLGQDEREGYPWELTVRDVGAMLDFPAGTFAGPDADALRATQAGTIWPVVASLALGGIGLALALLGLALLVRRGLPAAPPGVLRDALRWLAPALGVASFAVFVWLSMDVSADHPVVGPTGWACVAGLAGAGLALWLAWRKGSSAHEP